MKKNIDWMVVSIIVGLVVFVAIGILLAFSSTGETQKNVTSYQSSDQERPRAELLENNFDFGEIGVSDTKIKEFTLINTGQKTLSLFAPTTSCNCTSVQIKSGENISPMFSMHSTDRWTGEVAPGGSATITVVYEPFKMPVFGSVTRTAMISTNDPDMPQLEINVSAFVE